MTVDVADRQLAGIAGLEVLGGGDVKAANSWEHPHAVLPVRGEAALDGGVARMRIPAPGLAVLRLETRRA